ncbi:MAG TPA: OmpA family protein [Bacteroidetes bacterium]|nr:OmpA family protein [Bacteroidota bacterium]
MKKITLLFTLFFMLIAFMAFAQPGPELKNPEPGKCYAECYTPTTYEKITVPVTIKAASMRVEFTPASFADASEQILKKEGRKDYSPVAAKFEKAKKQVLVKDSYKVLTIIPAKFETVKEEVLLKDAYKIAKVIPATYKTETFQKMVKPGYTTYEKKPVEYKTVSEEIEISPKSSKWVKKRSGDNCTSANPDDCMIWCLVEIPAQYKTIFKKVKGTCEEGWMLKGDDCVKTIKVDPVYKTYKKKVIDTPSKVEYTEVPAVYKTRTYQKLVADARVEEKVIPAVYKDWKYDKLVADATVTETDVPDVYTNRAFKTLATDANMKEIEVPAEIINITKTKILVQGGFSDEYREVKCELLDYNLLPINWDFNSATLNGKAKKIIDDKLLPFLKAGHRIEIVSHTDSRGSDSYNMDLSERRAKAVVKYLISKGISPEMLESKGFGETMLKNNCSNGVPCTEEQHLQNRRTEFRILN